MFAGLVSAFVMWGTLLFPSSVFAQRPRDGLQVLGAQDRLASIGHWKIGYEVSTSSTQWKGNYDLQYDAKAFRLVVKSKGIDSETWSAGKWALERVKPNSINIHTSRELGMPKRNPAASPTGIGPQFTYGRGLSALKGLTLSDSGDKITATGRYQEFDVDAVLDPNHAFLARKIETRHHGAITPYLTIELESPAKDKRGLWYARRVRTVGRNFKQRFEFESVQKPGEKVASQPWISPKWDYSEGRDGMALYYTYKDLLDLNNGKEPTLDELYEISRARGKIFEAKRAESFAISARIKSGRDTKKLERLIATVGIGIGLLGIVYVAKKQFNASK